MIGKVCYAPKLVDSVEISFMYDAICCSLIGEGPSMAEMAGLGALYAEATARADLGIGSVWEPAARHGIRPKTVLAKNGTSFATMPFEAQANAGANRRVSPVMHLVVIWNEHETHSGKISNKEACEAAANILERLGLGHHRQLVSVHCDTLRLGKAHFDDPSAGNLHAHVAIERLDPATGLAYDLTQFNLPFCHATRQEEIERGWEHDRGPYVVKERDGTAVIERATVEEHEAWIREIREERLDSLEREGSVLPEPPMNDFNRYVDASVAPRLASALETAIESGAPPWAELHLTAARYGTQIEEVVAENGTRSLQIRNISTQAFRQKQAEEREQFIARLPENETGKRSALWAFDRAQREALDAERIRVRTQGEAVPLALGSAVP